MSALFDTVKDSVELESSTSSDASPTESRAQSASPAHDPLSRSGQPSGRESAATAETSENIEDLDVGDDAVDDVAVDETVGDRDSPPGGNGAPLIPDDDADGSGISVPVEGSGLERPLSGGRRTPAASAEHSDVTGRPGRFRPFSLQVLLGKRREGEPFDVDLEDELLAEIERAGVDVSRFKAKLAKGFKADERDAALSQLQEDFHTTLHEFEHLCRRAGSQLAHRQRQAVEVAGTLLRAAVALSLLLEKLDGELKAMRGEHSHWVVNLEKALSAVHGDQESRLNAEFNHVQKVIAAVRSGSADVARLLDDIDKRGRETLANHRAIVDQYTGFTGSIHRKLLISSAAAGVAGAVLGSLLGILLFFWSGGPGP